jgi:hypothetical protein
MNLEAMKAGGEWMQEVRRSGTAAKDAHPFATFAT